MSEESGSAPAGTLSVRLRFTPSLRAVLIDIVGRVHAAQNAAPEEHAAPKGQPDELSDPELQAAWAEGLREREEYDTRGLLGLVLNPKFGLADLPVAPANAEAIARASVRVRLHLRETLLRDLNSTQVDGDLDVFRLPLSEQQGYACFRLLAHLEEDLILQLDSGLAKS